MQRALLFLLVVAMTGCAFRSPKANLPPVASNFPADALITQRGIFKALGREFPINGYVSKSESEGLRLVLLNDFGSVLAETTVDPQGKITVVRAQKPFREKWVERYVANDLKCIFGVGNETNCAVRMVGTNHYIVERRWYRLDLRTVKVEIRAPGGTR